MVGITVFSAARGDGAGQQTAEIRSARAFLISALVFFFLPLAVAVQATQAMAANGTIGILPVSLGHPEGCPFTSANALNSGSYPEELVVAGAVYCGGDYEIPYKWSGGQWTPLELPEGALGGRATGIDDNPEGPATLVYSVYTDNQAYVLTEGATPTKLELLPDMIGSEMNRLAAEGGHIVGDNWNGSWDAGYNYHAVRWTRDGSAWSAPEQLAPGRAVASSADGSTVVGNSDVLEWSGNASPWVWRSGPGGGLVFLDPSAFVNDITHDGTVIVGSRSKPCANPGNCDFFPAPVYWTTENGNWVMHDLEALDGVDSMANAVAIVNGMPIIVGFGWRNQDGGVLRPVAWLPDQGGVYGPPLVLESLGGNPDSWAEAKDINRNGLVLGWSEIEPYGGAFDVVWSLTEQLPFQINGGITDAWYNPVTSGQGFSIHVWEQIQEVFLAWFTYDTGRPGSDVGAELGEPGHRWLTAQGSYADDRAVLDITLTEGGVFDAALPAPERQAIGTITLEFSSCIAGTVSYDIPSIGRQGTIEIQRISSANVANCERAAASQ
jgi:uncharacterized membrane protein